MKRLSTPQRNLATILALLALLTFSPVIARNDVAEQPCTAPPSASAVGGRTDEREHTIAALTDAGVSAAENIFTCMNRQQYGVVAALATSGFLRREFGIQNPEDAGVVLRGVPPFVLHFLSTPRVHGDGSVSVNVIYRRETGAHMLVHERWFFVERDAKLLLERLEPLAIVPGGPRVTIRAVLSDASVTLSHNHVASDQNLIFDVRNVSITPREFAVFKLPGGVEQDQRKPSDVPTEGQFIGITSAEPGRATDNLVLVGLGPGRYALVSSATIYGSASEIQQPLITILTVK